MEFAKMLTKWTKKGLILSLITGLFASLASSAHAQDQFDNNDISFSQDTIVEFEFIRSHGSNQSTFGVLNITTGVETVFFQEIKPYDQYGSYRRDFRIEGQNNTNQSIDYVGTIGNSVISGPNVTVVNYPNKTNGAVIEFLFKENENYVFFLESRTPYGQVQRTFLSTQAYTQFDGDLAGGNMSDRYGRNIIGSSIAWEDGGEELRADLDFDDFVVEAGGVLRDSCNCYNNNNNLITQSSLTQQYYLPYYYYNQHQKQPMYYYYQPHYLY